MIPNLFPYLPCAFSPVILAFLSLHSSLRRRRTFVMIVPVHVLSPLSVFTIYRHAANRIADHQSLSKPHADPVQKRQT
jgi:hypothetical protein